MTNHFTDLGFDVVEASDLTDLLLHGAGLADEFPLDSGRVLMRWAVGAGIELWIQVDALGELVGVHPFFLGPSRIRFLLSRIDVSDEPHDGALMGWVDPGGADDGIPGAYPIRIDLPAFPLGAENLGPGSVFEIQVAAFAEEIAVYRTELEFDAAQDVEAQFAVKSFVPIGLLPPDGEDDEDEGDLFGESLLRPQTAYQPVAECLFSGIISRCEKRVNPFTQSPFWWLQISTFGAEYDAVVDPDLLLRDPQPGEIIQGQFWMAARITEPPP